MGRLAPEHEAHRGETMNPFIFIVRFTRLAFYTLLLFAALSGVLLTLLIFIAAANLPKLPEPLSRIIETPKSVIYASTGERLITLGGREPIPLSRVSPHFINAVLAVEDHMFWEHHGINKLRTLKALYITLTRPEKIEGASTITQQLAKNLFFSFEKTYLRKFRELLVAFQIEYSCTKEEILHAYINQIPFGAGTQGVEKAAQVFFGKPAADLTLGEAALLAGLPKSPTRYNPYRHYERALKRRDIVIRRMLDAGYIEDKKYQEILNSKPQLHSDHADARTGSYFLDAVILELVNRYGSDVVYHGGIRVTTSIDASLQHIAEKALAEGLVSLDTLMGLTTDDTRPQAALVAVDTSSGAVKAMVGGRNYYQSEYNRAINSKRQAGSGFKPFLYYTAFDRLNLHGATIMTDRPVAIPVIGAPTWKPRNFEKTNKGQMILKTAFTNSVNTISAQLVAKTGPETVIETARLCGITSPLEHVYSVALGTSDVTLLEMASAYATFASGGVRHTPFLIWRVEDAFGRVIYEHLVQGKNVLDADTVYQVVDMMKAVIDTGSGKSIRAMGFKRPAAGKTGTTNDYKDAWFTGFTPSLCTSVWTGFDRKKTLKTKGKLGITGGRGPAPIWAIFMKQALAAEPPRDFPIPDGIHFEEADTRTGCLAKASEPGDTMPIPLKQGQKLCRELFQ